MVNLVLLGPAVPRRVLGHLVRPLDRVEVEGFARMDWSTFHTVSA